MCQFCFGEHVIENLVIWLISQSLILSAGSGYSGHIDILAPAAQELDALQKRAQRYHITMLYKKPFLKR